MVSTGLLVQGRNESVPLKEISVRAFLQGYVVGFRSKFTYENESAYEPLEVLFRTPVDDSYAIVDLEAVLDGRKIRAKIHEKEKAKELYQEAIATGHTAAFGEEKKGDIFSIVLGNLPPGKKAEIHLTMVGELDVEPDGSVRFVLPTVLKPRYTPAGSSDPLEPVAKREERPVKYTECPLSAYKFELVISGADDIAEVTSPSHRIKTQPSGQVINVGVDLDEETQEDVVILVRCKEPHKPLVIVEPGLSNGGNNFQKSTAVMVSFFPEFKGDTSCTQAACELVFLVDRSGSMDGQYICYAAQTLLLFLKSISEGCYFNIVGFGSSYEKLFPESVPYNQENLEKAERHTESLQADLGGTEIFDPLKDIFGVAQMKGLPRQVFVLTDGSISNTESVIKLVSDNSHQARCFSFGIGSGASSALVKGIAHAGRGTAEFITSGERMQPKVIRSLKKAMQPAVTSAEVKYGLPKCFDVQSAPENVPPMFIGERTIVYGILTQPPDKGETSTAGSIIISGDLLGAKIEHKVKFKIPVPVPKDDDTVTTIHYLAAKKLIKEMEVKNSGRDNNEIVILSCDSNVISSLTGFIAIDEDQKEPVKGSVQIWDIQAPRHLYYGLSSLGCKRSHSSMIFGASYGSGPTNFEVFNDPMFQQQQQSQSQSSQLQSSAFSFRPSPIMQQQQQHQHQHLKSLSQSSQLQSSAFSFRPSQIMQQQQQHQQQHLKSLSQSSQLQSSAFSFRPSQIMQQQQQQQQQHLQTLSQLSQLQSSASSLRPFLLKENLPTIISLQMANGAWHLTAELAAVVGKTVEYVKQCCPVPCDGETEVIWATVLALSYLQQKESAAKEEWELIAAKAETWLQKQSMSDGSLIQILRQKAIGLIYS